MGLDPYHSSEAAAWRKVEELTQELEVERARLSRFGRRVTAAFALAAVLAGGALLALELVALGLGR
jgi:hypothetical protein